jgi:hypothetical protein
VVEGSNDGGKATPLTGRMRCNGQKPGNARIRPTKDGIGQPLMKTARIKEAAHHFAGLLVVVAIALAISYALFGDDPLAVLGFGILAFAGVVIVLILLAFVGQLLMDVSDPAWRADFRKQLSDLKEAMRARRTFFDGASIPSKDPKVAREREVDGQNSGQKQAHVDHSQGQD